MFVLSVLPALVLAAYTYRRVASPGRMRCYVERSAEPDAEPEPERSATADGPVFATVYVPDQRGYGIDQARDLIEAHASVIQMRAYEDAETVFLCRFYSRSDFEDFLSDDIAIEERAQSASTIFEDISSK